MSSRFLLNLRFAIRLWRRYPLHTFLVVLTVALCMGANIAVFSAVYGVLLKPLNLPEPERLCYQYNRQPGIGMPISSISYRDYLDRREVSGFEESAAYHYGNLALTMGQGSVSASCIRTTSTFFDAVGVHPSLGKGWEANAQNFGEHRVAVISYGAWKELFAGEESIVGETVQIDRETWRIIGVMPEGFEFPSKKVKFFVPAVIQPEMMTDDERGNEYWVGVARLNPGVTPEQAEAEANGLLAQVLERVPDLALHWEQGQFRSAVLNVHRHQTDDEAPMLWMTQAVAVLVLVLGVSNILGLYVSQTISRSHELSVRVSVGAKGSQMLGQLITESLALAVIGGALGLALSWPILSGLEALGFDSLPRSSEIGLHVPVVIVAVCATLALGLVLGVAQGIYLWRSNLAQQLKGGTRSSADLGKSRMRAGLVVLEVALALSLLIGAGLLSKSFNNLVSQDPGYNPEGVVYGTFFLPDSVFPEDQDRRQFLQRIRDEVATRAEVESAGIAQCLPFSGSNWGNSYEIEGYAMPEGIDSLHCDVRFVSPGYFETMGIHLVEGRFFDETDGAKGRYSAVVNRYWLEHYGVDGSALGQRVRLSGRQDEDGESQWCEIVGVVENVKFSSLDQPTSKEMLYIPTQYMPVPFNSLVVKADEGLDAKVVADLMRSSLSKVDSSIPFSSTGTLSGYFENHLAGRKAAMSLVMISGGLAFILSITGLYGIVASTLRQRRSEIAIRMALGASRGSVFRFLWLRGAVSLLFGVVVGVVGAVVCSRWIQSMLFQVDTGELSVYLVASLLLIGTGLLSIVGLSRKATHIQPASALREG